MRTIKTYHRICENYINGNLGDFRRNLKGLSKRDLLTLEWQLAVNFLGGNFEAANNALHKYLGKEGK